MRCTVLPSSTTLSGGDLPAMAQDELFAHVIDTLGAALDRLADRMRQILTKIHFTTWRSLVVQLIKGSIGERVILQKPRLPQPPLRPMSVSETMRRVAGVRREKASKPSKIRR